MHRDRDFDPSAELPANEQALTQDLELDTLLDAMAAGDEFLFEVAQDGAARRASRDPDGDPLPPGRPGDCLDHPAVVTGDLRRRRRGARSREAGAAWAASERSPDSILHGSVQMMELLVGVAASAARSIADEHAGEFRSEGFTQLLRDARRGARRRLPRSRRGHLERLRVPRRRADQRAARHGQPGHGYVASQPPREQRTGSSGSARRTGRRYTLPDRRPRRERARGRWRSCEAAASTSSPTRSPNRPTTSSASSGCCAPSSASTSAA